MGTVGLPELLVMAILSMIIIVLPVWRIASRLGYPGAIGLLAAVPGLNILLVWFLAFADWPLLAENRRLKGGR